MQRSPRLRMIVKDAHVWPREDHRADNQTCDAGDRGPDMAARHGRSAASEPAHHDSDPDPEHEVQELESEREAEAQLPGRSQPSGDDLERTAPPITAKQEEERQRDPAPGKHVEVARLAEAPWRGRASEASGVSSSKMTI